MIANTARTWIVALFLGTLTSVAASVAVAQTQFKPGFNLFSPAQDEEIGRQSAEAAERELPAGTTSGSQATCNASPIAAVRSRSTSGTAIA